MSSQDHDLDQLLAQAASATMNIASTLNDHSENSDSDTIVTKRPLPSNTQSKSKTSKFDEESTDEEIVQKRRQDKLAARSPALLTSTDIPSANTSTNDDITPDNDTVDTSKNSKRDRKDKKSSRKDKKDKKSSKKDKKSSKKDKKSSKHDTSDGDDDDDDKIDNGHKSTTNSAPNLDSDSDTITHTHKTPIKAPKQPAKMGSKYLEKSSSRLEVNSDDSDDFGVANPMRSTVKVRGKRQKTPTKDKQGNQDGDDEGQGFGMLKAMFSPDKEDGKKHKKTPKKLTEKQRRIEQENLKKAEILKLKKTSTTHITKDSLSIVDSLFDELDEAFTSIKVVNKAKMDADKVKELEETWAQEKRKKLIGEKTSTGLIVFGSSSDSDGDESSSNSDMDSEESDFDLVKETNGLNRNISMTGSTTKSINDSDVEYDENENLLDSHGRIVHSHLHGGKRVKGSDNELSSALDSDLEDPYDMKDSDNSDTTDQETWERDGLLFNKKIDQVAELMKKKANGEDTKVEKKSSVLDHSAHKDDGDGDNNNDHDDNNNNNNNNSTITNDENDLFFNDSKPSMDFTATMGSQSATAATTATPTTTTQPAKSRFSLFDDDEDWAIEKPKQSNNVLKMMKIGKNDEKMDESAKKAAKSALFQLDDDESSSSEYDSDDEFDSVVVKSSNLQKGPKNNQSKRKRNSTASLAMESLRNAMSDDENDRNHYGSASESDEFGTTPNKRNAKKGKNKPAARKSLMGDTTTSSSSESSSSEEVSEEETEEARELRIQRRLDELEKAQRNEKKKLKQQDKNKYVDLNDVDESDGEGGVKSVKKNKDGRDDGLFSDDNSDSSSDDENDADYLTREELLEQARFLADDDEVAKELRKHGGKHTGKGSLMEQEEEEWIQDVKREERQFLRQQMEKMERERKKNRMFRHSFFDSGFAHDEAFFGNDVIFENTDLTKHQQRLLHQIQLQKGRELTQDEIDIILGGNAERRALKQQLKDEQQAQVDARYTQKFGGGTIAPSATTKSTHDANKLQTNDEKDKKKKKKNLGSDSDTEIGSGGLSLVARLNRTLQQYNAPKSTDLTDKKVKTEKLSKTMSTSSVASTDSNLTSTTSLQKNTSTTSTTPLNTITEPPIKKAPSRFSFDDIGDDELDPGNTSSTINPSKPSNTPQSTTSTNTNVLLPPDHSNKSSTQSRTSIDSTSPFDTIDDDLDIDEYKHKRTDENGEDINDVDDIDVDDDDNASSNDDASSNIEDSDDSDDDDDSEMDLEALDDRDCPDKETDPDGYHNFQQKLKQRDAQRERQQLLLLAQHHGSKLLKTGGVGSNSLNSITQSRSPFSPNGSGPSLQLQRSGTALSRNVGGLESKSLQRSSTLQNSQQLQPQQLHATFSSAFNQPTSNHQNSSVIHGSNNNLASRTLSNTSTPAGRTNSALVAKTQSATLLDSSQKMDAHDFSTIKGAQSAKLISSLSTPTDSGSMARRKTTSGATIRNSQTTTATSTLQHNKVAKLNSNSGTHSLFARPTRQSSLHPTLTMMGTDQTPNGTDMTTPQGATTSSFLSSFDQVFTTSSFASNVNANNNANAAQNGPGKAVKKQIVLSRDVVTATNAGAFAQLDRDEQHSRSKLSTHGGSSMGKGGDPNGATDFSSFKIGSSSNPTASTSGPTKHKANPLFDQDDDIFKSVKKQRKSNDVSSIAGATSGFGASSSSSTMNQKPGDNVSWTVRPLDKGDGKSLLSSLKSAGPSKK